MACYEIYYVFLLMTHLHSLIEIQFTVESNAWICQIDQDGFTSLFIWQYSNKKCECNLNSCKSLPSILKLHSDVYMKYKKPFKQYLLVKYLEYLSYNDLIAALSRYVVLGYLDRYTEMVQRLLAQTCF